MIESGDKSPAPGIPLAALQELVAQYHHRILSLEADLKDQGRARTLSPRAFAKRVKRLQEVQESLNSLQRLCVAETPSQIAATDIGMPMLEACTPAEKSVCERFLEDREDAAVQTFDEASHVYKWLVDAVTGRTGPIRMTLRLSKLRRLLQKSEKDSQTLHELSKSSAIQVDKLLRRRGAIVRDSGQSTLEALMAIFNQMDGTISRVARLKALVRKDQEKTRAMEAWLRRAEDQIRARPANQAPPTPLTVTRAENVALSPRPTYRKASKRRRIAEEFWHDVVHNGARPPTENEINRAASFFSSIRDRESK